MGVLGTKGILRIGVLIVAFSFDSSVALPAEQPTRFTLSTGDETSKDVASTTRFDQGRVSDFSNSLESRMKVRLARKLLRVTLLREENERTVFQ